MTDSYDPPTPAEVRAMLRALELTGTDAAALVGLSDGRQIRKYTGGTDPRRMAFATLYTLLHRARSIVISPGGWRTAAAGLLADRSESDER